MILDGTKIGAGSGSREQVQGHLTSEIGGHGIRMDV